jgi:hypothetical protein
MVTTDELAKHAQEALKTAESKMDLLDSIGDVRQQAREAWRQYGAALETKRVETPSPNVFGQWVRENGLDTGRAKVAAVRSDAMWLARNWSALLPALKQTQCVNPQDIRQDLRNADVEVAFSPEEWKKRQAEVEERIRRARVTDERLFGRARPNHPDSLELDKGLAFARLPLDAPIEEMVKYLSPDQVADYLTAAKILGVPYPCRPEVLQAVYRMYSSKYHPDREGGSTEVMAYVNQARNILEK